MMVQRHSLSYQVSTPIDIETLCRGKSGCLTTTNITQIVADSSVAFYYNLFIDPEDASRALAIASHTFLSTQSMQ